MKAINSYLNFEGTTEQAFNFYRSIFGGDFSALVRYGELPKADAGTDDNGCPGMVMPSDDKIMHISLPLPTGNILMATDVAGSDEFPFKPGNNFSIAITADDIQEGRKLYDALSQGGQPMMPFAPADWGGHWGMLVDQFGIQWMVDCE